MPNSYYNHSGVPATQSLGVSQAMRTEFGLIAQGFDKVAQDIGGSGFDFASVVTLTGTTALTANEVGAQLAYNSASAGTVTLPNPLALPIGSVISITNLNNGICTLSRFGSDLIFAGGALAGRASVALRRGQWLVLVSNGTDWVETAGNLDPIIDMTGYSGADIAIGVGQKAFYSPSAVTSLPLRLATGNAQLYSLKINAAVGLTAQSISLFMNNALLTNMFVNMQMIFTPTNGTIVAGGVSNAGSVAVLSTFSPRSVSAEVCTNTNGKTVMSHSMATDVGVKEIIAQYYNYSGDPGTAWTSLGTLSFSNAFSGTVIAERKA